jgi:predicted amidohydrolase YtcJ
VGLAQALRSNTLDAAYQLRLDHLTGSIEVGKRADLVVLEQNLFEVATPDIYKTKIAMTMMNGRFTHGG